MVSRYVCTILLGVLTSAILFAETQKIGISAFSDISPEPDEVISTIIQHSLVNVLKREKRFHVTIISNTIPHLSAARETGMGKKLDVILYGSYQKEGREFIILIQIYDILENEIRLSRLYRGEYSRNIFDTVDVIAASASEEISRILPPLLTEEDIIRAQAKRKELYEQKEVSVRREMRIATGPAGFFNRYTFERKESYNWGYNGYYRLLSGNNVTLVPNISLSARFEWLRFSFVKTGFPWLPNMHSVSGEETIGITNISKQSFSSNTIILSTPPSENVELRGDFFLGSPEKLQWFMSLFLCGVSFQVAENTREFSSPFMLGVGGGVSRKNWEISLLVQVFPFSQGWKEIIPGFPTDIKEEYRETQSSVDIYQWNFPLISLSASYFFFPSFGIHVKGSFLDAQFLNYQKPSPDSESIEYLHIAPTILSVEAIYRFQFGL